MRWRNPGPLAALIGAALLVAVTSCSDDNDDSVGSACKVIVNECHVGTSMGDCVDAIGPLPLECIDCIATHHDCKGDQGYATCQLLPSGCRIPVELMGP